MADDLGIGWGLFLGGDQELAGSHSCLFPCGLVGESLDAYIMAQTTGKENRHHHLLHAYLELSQTELILSGVHCYT